MVIYVDTLCMYIIQVTYGIYVDTLCMYIIQVTYGYIIILCRSVGLDKTFAGPYLKMTMMSRMSCYKCSWATNHLHYSGQPCQPDIQTCGHFSFLTFHSVFHFCTPRGSEVQIFRKRSKMLDLSLRRVIERYRYFTKDPEPWTFVVRCVAQRSRYLTKHPKKVEKISKNRSAANRTARDIPHFGLFRVVKIEGGGGGGYALTGRDKSRLYPRLTWQKSPSPAPLTLPSQGGTYALTGRDKSRLYPWLTWQKSPSPAPLTLPSQGGTSWDWETHIMMTRVSIGSEDLTEGYQVTTGS